MKSEILVFFFLNTRLRENVTRDVMRLVQKKSVQKKTNHRIMSPVMNSLCVVRVHCVCRESSNK